MAVNDVLWSGPRTGPWHAYVTEDGTPLPRSLCGRQRLPPYPQLAEQAPANRRLCPHCRSLAARLVRRKRGEQKDRQEVATIRITSSRALLVAVVHGEVLLTVQAGAGLVLGTVRLPRRVLPDVVAALKQTNETLHAGQGPSTPAA